MPIGTNRVLMAEWRSEGEVSDADINQWQSTSATEAINVHEVLNGMQMAQNPVNIVMLEASHPLTVPGLPNEIRLPGELALMTAEDALIAYAASSGQVSQASQQRNSFYVKQLIQSIPRANLRMIEVLDKVRAAVQMETNGRQVPNYSNRLKRPFYFNRVTQ